MSACMSIIRQLSIALAQKVHFCQRVYLQGILVKFVYEGHEVKVEVMGSKIGSYDRN